jgi:hypothetical protein
MQDKQVRQDVHHVCLIECPFHADHLCFPGEQIHFREIKAMRKGNAGSDAEKLSKLAEASKRYDKYSAN